MNQRRIDPTLYVQAADAFDAVATQSDTVGSSARSSLSSFGRMAGDDPGGEQFAAGYDESAGAALQAVFDIGIRANAFDRLFMACGANAASAEAYAAGLPFDSGSYPLRDARAPLNVAPPPTAFGGSGGEPHGWEFVTDFIGMMWPNANTDQLDQAASAWTQVAGDLRSLATSIRQGDDSLASLNSSELVRARAEVTDFATDVTDFATLLDDLATQCTDYASDVRDAHQEVIEMLAQLVIEIAATVAISAALSVFTFGASAAVGAGAMAARIAFIGGRILTILVRVGGTAARVAVRIRAVRASLIPFALRFRKPATAAINIVSGTLAAGISEVAVKQGDANMLVALASGLVGGGVTEAIAAPFGRYGQRVLVQALAGGGGGMAGAASSGLMTDGTVDIRQVIISGVGGAGFSGWGARGGSGRGGSSSAADPGGSNVNIDGDNVPVITGGGDTSSTGTDGGRTGSTDYEGPTVTGGEDSGSSSVDGGRTGSTDYEGPTVTGGEDVGGSTSEPGNVQVPQGEAPQPTEIDVTPPTNTGGNNSSGGTNHNDTPLFHDTEVDLGIDVDGDGNVGAPPVSQGGGSSRPDEMDTPLFHETETDLGMDVDGDGFTGRPPVTTTPVDGGPAPVRADDVDGGPAPVRADEPDVDPAPASRDPETTPPTTAAGEGPADPPSPGSANDVPADGGSDPVPGADRDPIAPAGDVDGQGDPLSPVDPAGGDQPVPADATAPADVVADTNHHPLLDQAFPHRTGVEPRADTVRIVNEIGAYSDRGRFMNNCHYVVNAFELRMRGYDVMAQPTVQTAVIDANGNWGTGYAPRQWSSIEADWVQPDGTHRFFDALSTGAHSDPRAALEAYTASWPVGGRGFIGGAWNPNQTGFGGGHIFTVVREADGIRLYDGQVNNSDVSSYLDDMYFAGRDGVDHGDMLIMRVDDLVPTSDVLATSRPYDADGYNEWMEWSSAADPADRPDVLIDGEIAANERWRERNDQFIADSRAILADPSASPAEHAFARWRISALLAENYELEQGLADFLAQHRPPSGGGSTP
jgi:hypothetical protein